jgi:subtilase family serine protease
MKQTLSAVILVVALAIPVVAQNSPRPLITNPIDETQRTILRGNMSPLAQARYDQGAVDDSFPAKRVLLMLNRPPDRQAALQQYLAVVHSKGSASYHHWLTPQAFAQQFGSADTDVQTVTNWLGSKGFRVAKVSQGKQYIEFSGTAGQLRDAFQAEIHQYYINGETHYANAREISVPTALAQVIRGLAPLNNFAPQPYVQLGGIGRYSKLTHKLTPDWTVPNPFGSSNPLGFLVAPEDLATQYDITPLYQAGTKGTGQVIGIIDGSNIDLTLVSNFQQLFGLPSNPPQVIIDGDDPGDVPDADIETYLDVEISGAIAPQSAIDLYISDGGSLADPLAFAAIRAVDDNAASVLSASFGQCEGILGDSGNQFWGTLWEQAAAQGQTVMVATGDSGPICNPALGISVSGIASTPWNVAVGGTDFYYSDYATGGASAPSFWNATNDANLGSLKAPLQEQPWNDGFGLDVIPNGFEFGQIGAGGGGASSCATSNSSTGACIAGYPKPNWQAGTGVPADGVRDIPDVSWFASNGANLSSYAICAFEGECTTEPATDAEIFFVGGTSASAPAMAGIMALVNQKFGRQGQADFTLYALAKQKPAAFHDITVGSNSVPCSSGETDCANEGNGIDQTTVYSAGPGYDQATGLGSIDANVLVSNWDAITFKPTTTTLSLSPTTVTHGAPVIVKTIVSGASGDETPSGDVAILTNSPEPATQSQTFLSLSNGSGNSSVNFFPGGTYQVTANYAGDGTFGASNSAPVTLTVTPENSVLAFEVTNNNTGYAASGFNVPYNTPVSLVVEPVSKAAASGGQTDGVATGTTTFKVDSSSSTVPLDSEGFADLVTPTLAVGSHTVSATYSGDPSFNPSSASPITFNVTKGTPGLNANIFAPIPGVAPIFVVSPGASLTVVVQVAANSTAPGTAAPSGNVMACLGTNPSINAGCIAPIYTQSGTLAPPSGIYAQISTATVTFPNLAAGEYVFSFSYGGDTNWQPASFVLVAELINVQAAAALAASTNELSITPATFSGSQLVQVTTTITGSGNSGIAPSGVVAYYDNGLVMTESLLTATGPQTAKAMFVLVAADFFNNGANQITSIYEGDTHYLPSNSNGVSVTAAQLVGNFLITPQAEEITVQPGNSTSVGIGLTSVSNFNGMVTLSCVTSSPNIACGVPGSVALNGVAAPMLMVTAAADAESVPGGSAKETPAGPGGAVVAVLASLLLMSLAMRRKRPALVTAMELFAVILVIAACGGGGSGSQAPPPPPPPPAATYSVVVTATGNGIVHNARIIVLVP